MCKYYLIMMIKLFFSKKKKKLLKSGKEQVRSKNTKLQDSFMHLWFYPAAEVDTFSLERPIIQRMTAAATADRNAETNAENTLSPYLGSDPMLHMPFHLHIYGNL